MGFGNVHKKIREQEIHNNKYIAKMDSTEHIWKRHHVISWREEGFDREMLTDLKSWWIFVDSKMWTFPTLIPQIFARFHSNRMKDFEPEERNYTLPEVINRVKYVENIEILEVLWRI